jgi:hypothetical protein
LNSTVRRNSASRRRERQTDAVSFFEAPPPPPEPAPHVRTPWDGPPNNVLGIVVPLNILLAQSPTAAVTLGSITAYPDGFEFDYLIRSTAEELGQSLAEHLHRRRSGTGLPDDLFRFGVEFADGTRLTSLGSRMPWEAGDTSKPAMVPRGGGGSYERWLGNWWVTPLPSTGLLAFVCEWPAAGISLTRVEIDSDPIREAATRATTLWDGESSTGSPGAGYSVGQIVATTLPPAD